MGIASSRTTDTGVFIKPTAETGWKEISLLQKGKEVEPSIELDFLISELVLPSSLFFLYLLSKDTSIGSHTTRKSYETLTTITTTTTTNLLSYFYRYTTLNHGLSSVLHLPDTNLDVTCKVRVSRKGPGHSRPFPHSSNRSPLLFRHPIDQPALLRDDAAQRGAT